MKKPLIISLIIIALLTSACSINKKRSITVSTATGKASCGQATVTDLDNNVYNTIQIGTQCWLQQNMNVGVMVRDVVVDQKNNGIIEKYCYDAQPSNCALYGGLYQWSEALQYYANGDQGICPAGWHIPSNEEFHTLENYLKDGGESCRWNKKGKGCAVADIEGNTCEADRLGWGCSTAGIKLTGTKDLWKYGELNIYDNFGVSGFNALPAGSRLPVTKNGFKYGYSYGGMGSMTFFWSSLGVHNDAWRFGLGYNHPGVQRVLEAKIKGLSIRCIMN